MKTFTTLLPVALPLCVAAQVLITDPRIESALQPGDPISSLTNNVGYITNYIVTVGDVTNHQAAIQINENQITNLQTYVKLVTDTNTPASAGVLRHYSVGTNAYIEVGMQTGQDTIEWVEIMTYTWSVE